MSDHIIDKGMTAKGALRLEAFIIGLGILALLLIFQPFSIKLFAIGSALHLTGRKGPVDTSFFKANAATLTGSQGPTSGSVRDRESWIRFSLEQWSRTPGTIIAGVGLGPDLTGTFGQGNRTNRQPHDDYLQVLSRMGIIGLTLYLWLLFTSIKPIVLKARHDPHSPEGKFCAWISAAVLIYLGGSAVQPLMTFPYGTIPMWFLIGLGLAASRGSLVPEGGARVLARVGRLQS